MPPRKATPDTQSATAQLRGADQSARVAKANRPVKKAGELVAKLGDREFRLAQDVGIMPLMEWAASADVDVASADGLRAVYYVLQDVVEESEWADFRRYAREHKVDAEELLEFANGALEALAGRPTEESSGS